jgi:RNA polymerase sigma-70 factor (ECF subfamily)
LEKSQSTYHPGNEPRQPVTGRAEEAVLVSRILAGEVDEFEIIIHQYQERIVNLIKRHLHREDELDDALQDIFLRVYSSLPRFRGRANLYTWIYSIASKYLIDRLRKRRHLKISEDELEMSGREIETNDFGAGNPGLRWERSEETGLIWNAIETLDPLFKNILILREVDDMSYEELAEVLGVGVGTVKSRLFRARAELKKRYLALSKI